MYERKVLKVVSVKCKSLRVRKLQSVMLNKIYIYLFIYYLFSSLKALLSNMGCSITFYVHFLMNFLNLFIDFRGGGGGG